MTGYQAKQIRDFRMRGAGYKAIAAVTGLSRDIVRNYCKSHGLDGYPEELSVNMTEQIRKGLACQNCGTPLIRPRTGRPRRFCSDRCRYEWWGVHSSELRSGSDANYKYTCAHCGREFTAYGNAHRKYCSHDCYVQDRYLSGRLREEDNPK